MDIQTTVKGRREMKHSINKLDCYILRNNLKHIMRPDPHAKEKGTYLIRSIYFDNLDNKILNQKKDGNFRRDKYRVRLYDYNTQFINLEKKSKRDNVCFKEKCRITAEEYERIRNEDLSWMEGDSRHLVRELYIQMKQYQIKPMTVVDYEREVFIYDYGNVRVTFDSNVKSSMRNNDFLNPDLIMVPTIDPNEVILEVKYDNFIPDVIKQLLQVSDTRRTAYSKYQLSRRFV